MRVQLTGELVETDRNEWNYNGRSGVAYTLFVRPTGSRKGDAATRVKVSAEQFGAFEAAPEGAPLDFPVDVFANTVERGGAITGAKLSVTLDEDFRFRSGSPRPAGLASTG